MKRLGLVFLVISFAVCMVGCREIKASKSNVCSTLNKEKIGAITQTEIILARPSSSGDVCAYFSSKKTDPKVVVQIARDSEFNYQVSLSKASNAEMIPDIGDQAFRWKTQDSVGAQALSSDTRVNIVLNGAHEDAMVDELLRVVIDAIQP